MESIYSRPVNTPNTIPVTPPDPFAKPVPPEAVAAPAAAPQIPLAQSQQYVPNVSVMPSAPVNMGIPMADLPRVSMPVERSGARTSPLAWFLLFIVALIGGGFFAWREGYVALPEALRFLDANVAPMVIVTDTKDEQDAPQAMSQFVGTRPTEADYAYGTLWTDSFWYDTRASGTEFAAIVASGTLATSTPADFPYRRVDLNDDGVDEIVAFVTQTPSAVPASADAVAATSTGLAPKYSSAFLLEWDGVGTGLGIGWVAKPIVGMASSSASSSVAYLAYIEDFDSDGLREVLVVKRSSDGVGVSTYAIVNENGVFTDSEVLKQCSVSLAGGQASVEEVLACYRQSAERL